MTRPEARQPIYQEIRQILKRRIDSGDLAPGTILRVKAVARACGVSRAPAGHALALLRDAGCLEAAEEGAGFRVPGAAPGDVDGRDRRLGAAAAMALIAGDLSGSRPQPAWRRIHGEVERELASRAIFGALRVNEHELARHYSVSRTVAHDVLARLNHQGIVDKDLQSRWYVVPLTPARIRDLYEVRRLLEPRALLNAAAAIPEAELAAARDRLDAALARYPRLGVDELDALEQDLHARCFERGANRELLVLLRATRLLLASNKHMLGALVRLPPREPFLREHRAVFDRLLDRRPEAAAEALLRHLERAEVNVLERAEILRRAAPPAPPPYIRAD